jgi:RNA polymerase sigma-70 factor, ECF subfamily
MQETLHERGTDTVSDERQGARGPAVTRDQALFSAFLAGDAASLVAIFDRHNERLFRYCAQLVGDPNRAEDITQELWERIIRLRDEGRLTAENPPALLLRCVRNLCLDEIRRTRPHQSIESVAEEDHPFEEIPELTHLEEVVILALPHLPADQREIIVLHEYSGYSYEEIGAMMGESTGAIRTRAWRGRAHLARVVAAMLGMREGHDGERPRRPEDER